MQRFSRQSIGILRPSGLADSPSSSTFMRSDPSTRAGPVSPGGWGALGPAEAGALPAPSLKTLFGGEQPPASALRDFFEELPDLTNAGWQDQDV